MFVVDLVVIHIFGKHLITNIEDVTPPKQINPNIIYIYIYI